MRHTAVRCEQLVAGDAAPLSPVGTCHHSSPAVPPLAAATPTSVVVCPCGGLLRVPWHVPYGVAMTRAVASAVELPWHSHGFLRP